MEGAAKPPKKRRGKIYAGALLLVLAGITALIVVDADPPPAVTQALPIAAPQAPAAADPELPALLAALRQGQPRRRQLELKDETGEVAALAASGAAETAGPAGQLQRIQRNLAALSAGGVATHALLQAIASDGRLQSWLIFPDGRIVTGRSPGVFKGLGDLPDGLDVTRFALSRGPELKSRPPQARLDAERGGGDAATAARRMATLRETTATLLPGDVGRALAAGSGRLLIVPVRDSGTAPYAALPVAGPDDVAARRWSFVVMQDAETLASADFGFDLAAVDLRQSVVVGDPDDMRDVRFRFKPLPGARKEALAIAADLGLKGPAVLIGAAATRPAVVDAINRSDGKGMVYMATHAVADARNPLTRGFVVLSKTNLFAGELRVTQFRGWAKNHPLVVMSACQTALGRVFEGGTFGVARTWTNAGAGQVVASLWNVSDAATLRLMLRFADGLKAGQSPEAALQAAQLATLKDYPGDPRLWAGFTIIGKPTLSQKPSVAGRLLPD